MRNKKAFRIALVQFVIIVSVYLVFYPKIDTKPNDADFWFILAIGMSLGVVLAHLFRRIR